LSHEDARLTLMQIARIGGFRGRIALTSHSKPETEELLASGADHVFEPFQDAADRAAELVYCGIPSGVRRLVGACRDNEPDTSAPRHRNRPV
jgi:NADPH:quinone reductase-like Zn-dependent oxidoreductase